MSNVEDVFLRRYFIVTRSNTGNGARIQYYNRCPLKAIENPDICFLDAESRTDFVSDSEQI